MKNSIEKLRRRIIDEERGEMIRITDDKLMIDLLLRFGIFFDACTVEYKPCELLNMCYYYAGVYWKENKNCNIVTGYSLLGKIWFSHSWIIKAKDNLLIDFRHSEADRLDSFRYFGYVLSQREAERFYNLYKDDIIHHKEYEKVRDNLPKDMNFPEWMRHQGINKIGDRR